MGKEIIDAFFAEQAEEQVECRGRTGRTRAYYRIMRSRYIARKAHKCKACGADWYAEGQARGKLSKGKIHCSCPLCSAKTKRYANIRNRSVQSWKHTDRQKLLHLQQQVIGGEEKFE